MSTTPTNAATRNAIGTLNGLLRGEMAAVETYQQALRQVDEGPAAAKLRQLHQEHYQAVNTLREHITRQGGTPDNSSGAWGTFAQAVTGTAKLFGNNAALGALKQGEQRGVADYENALKEADLPQECRQLVQNTLLPQTRKHAEVLENLWTG